MNKQDHQNFIWFFLTISAEQRTEFRKAFPTKATDKEIAEYAEVLRTAVMEQFG